jgi:hypothetical protein
MKLISSIIGAVSTSVFGRDRPVDGAEIRRRFLGVEFEITGGLNAIRITALSALAVIAVAFVSQDLIFTRDLLSSGAYLAFRNLRIGSSLVLIVPISAVVLETIYRLAKKENIFERSPKSLAVALFSIRFFMIVACSEIYCFALLWQSEPTRIITCLLIALAVYIPNLREAPAKKRAFIYLLAALSVLAIMFGLHTYRAPILSWTAIILTVALCRRKLSRLHPATMGMKKLLVGAFAIIIVSTITSPTVMFIKIHNLGAAKTGGCQSRLECLLIKIHNLGKYKSFFPPFKEVYGPSNESYWPPGEDKPESYHTFYELMSLPSKRRLYFADQKLYKMGYINISSGKVVLSDRHEHCCDQFALMPGGATVVMDQEFIGDLVSLDGETLAEINRCPDLGDTNDLIMAPDGKRVVAIRGSNATPDVFWIDPLTCREDKIETATLSPYEVLCSTELHKCYVSGWFNSVTLSEINLDSNGEPTPGRSTVIGFWSHGMALDVKNRKLFVARFLAETVDVIDVDEFERILRIKTIPLIRSIVYIREKNWLLVAAYFDGRIAVHDASSGEMLGLFPSGRYIRDMKWDRKLKKVFIGSKHHLFSADPIDIEKMITPAKRRSGVRG